MTLYASLSLFLVLFGLAAMPSASVALVVTRAAMGGFRQGAAVAGGVVLGDLVFVALALLGMSFLAETLGAFFAVLKFAGGAYLIWLGIGLIRSRGATAAAGTGQTARPTSLVMSFAAGFLLTLGDVKAIFFYASLFPTFVDLTALTARDLALIVLVTIVAVGGVKLVYAFLAQRIVGRLQHPGVQAIGRTVAGGMLVGAGGYLLAKS
jgi:threonine/homoserine/homoserine lactone efflux protein